MQAAKAAILVILTIAGLFLPHYLYAYSIARRFGTPRRSALFFAGAGWVGIWAFITVVHDLCGPYGPVDMDGGSLRHVWVHAMAGAWLWATHLVVIGVFALIGLSRPLSALVSLIACGAVIGIYIFSTRPEQPMKEARTSWTPVQRQVYWEGGLWQVKIPFVYFSELDIMENDPGYGALVKIDYPTMAPWGPDIPEPRGLRIDFPGPKSDRCAFPEPAGAPKIADYTKTETQIEGHIIETFEPPNKRYRSKVTVDGNNQGWEVTCEKDLSECLARFGCSGPSMYIDGSLLPQFHTLRLKVGQWLGSIGSKVPNVR